MALLEALLIALAAILIGILGAVIPANSGLLSGVNIGTSLFLSCTLGWRVIELLQRDKCFLFTAELWFRIGVLTYFGVGNLVPYIIGDSAYILFVAAFPLGGEDILKYNLIVIISVIIVLVVNMVLEKPTARMVTNLDVLQKRENRSSIYSICVIVLGVGMTVRYGIQLPNLFGLTNFVLPGFISKLALLFHGGLFLLILLTLRTKGKPLYFSLLLLVTEFLVDIALFAKIELMLTCIVVLLAYIWDRFSLVRLGTGFAILVAIYYTFVPVVEHGRMLTSARYGTQVAISLGERIEFVVDYLVSDNPAYEASSDRFDRTISRFSYANVSAYVINAYDRGIPGDSYDNALAVLIPRIFWPDKPIISDLGTDFNYMLFGFRGTSTGIGLFSEAYWNFGWWGVSLAMAFYGMLVSFFSQVALVIMRREHWLYLPIALAGVVLGIRVDGWMSVDVIGSIAITIILFILLLAIGKVLQRAERRAH